MKSRAGRAIVPLNMVLLWVDGTCGLHIQTTSVCICQLLGWAVSRQWGHGEPPPQHRPHSRGGRRETLLLNTASPTVLLPSVACCRRFCLLSPLLLLLFP